jgi:hypothetical protein
MSGWPQHAWGLFHRVRRAEGGNDLLVLPGLDRYKDIRRDHPESPLLVGVAPNQRKRWHVNDWVEPGAAVGSERLHRPALP